MRLRIDSNIMCRAIDPIMQSLRTQTAEFAGMKAGDRAIDICCGPGSQVLHYAKAGIVASGIDIDPRMIEVAEKKRRKRGLSLASFQTASALSLPFQDSFFDYASISMALHEKGSMECDTVISEMKRVVKLKGAMVFIDYAVPLPKIASSYVSRLLEYIAGTEHYTYFKEYVQHGGLDTLLIKNHLHKQTRSRLGPIEMVKAVNLIFPKAV